MFEVRVSKAARKATAEHFGYLEGTAAETCAGWLTLLEEVDAQYAARLDPPSQDHTAILASMASDRHRRSRIQREWATVREPIARGFANFLAFFPKPLFITTEGLLELQCGVGGINVFHVDGEGNCVRGWRPTSPPETDR